MIEIIVSFVGFVVLMILGVICGTAAERRHFSDLQRREDSRSHFIRTQNRQFVEPIDGLPPTLLCSETVIANDYFKRFKAGLRTFFGGEVRSYNSLMERARRETLMRLIEQAEAMGYNAICNVRLEPADVGGNLEKKGKSMVCIFGSATAYRSSANTSAVSAMPVREL